MLNRQRQGAEGMRQYQRARRIDEQLVAADPNDRAAQRARAIDYEDFGRMFFFRKDYGRSVESLRKALSILEPLATADPNDEGSRTGLRIASELLATSLAYAGQPGENLAIAMRALSIAETERKIAPSATADKAVASCHGAVGDALWSAAKAGRRKVADAIREYEFAKSALEALGEPDIEIKSSLTYLNGRLAKLKAGEID